MRSMILSAMAVLMLGVIAWAKDPPTERREVGEYVLSGPYVHENLTVFLVHGQERLAGRKFLTLQEAMDQQKVIVHETGNVQELAIENVSDEEVYIQSGDIVKGGRQDRTIAFDLIVSARSGRVPIASFCVESGRWSQRAGEDAAAFSSSNNALASRELKLAAKYHNDQGQVWAAVSQSQQQLAENVGGTVADERSRSSLQLTLEHDKVSQTVDGYMAALTPVVEGKADVIGYAFAINGTVNSADVYASGELFRKLWPKLLHASAVEAAAAANADAPVVASAEAVAECFALPQAEEKDRQISDRVRLVTQESEAVIRFETQDQAGGGWVHRNYIRK
jgi:hypothetical protein